MIQKIRNLKKTNKVATISIVSLLFIANSQDKFLKVTNHVRNFCFTEGINCSFNFLLLIILCKITSYLSQKSPSTGCKATCYSLSLQNPLLSFAKLTHHQMETWFANCCRNHSLQRSLLTCSRNYSFQKLFVTWSNI